MTSNFDRGSSNNNRSSISDRNRTNDNDNINNPARDFLPPRSHVRKRQPTSTESLSLSTSYVSSREVEEGLAYKAARDQLSGNKQWRRSDATERKSSASSISSFGIGGSYNESLNTDLFRGPVGSFAEDSPPRDRGSPNTYHTAYTFSDHPNQTSEQHQFYNKQHDDSGFMKWSDNLAAPSASFDYPSTDSVKVTSKTTTPSKHVITTWNALLEDFGDKTIPSPSDIGGTTTSISPMKSAAKNMSMQDIFRSPPVHDLKRRNQGSPSFSFGAIDTPGVQSQNFSPMADFTDEDYDERKSRKLPFAASYEEDDIEDYPFVPTLPPAIVAIQDELEGVRRSPLQSSSERKTLSAKKAASTFVPVTDDHKTQPKLSDKASNVRTDVEPIKKSHKHSEPVPRTLWLDSNVTTGNVRRVTMGEPQSSRSLADINSMMRGESDHGNISTSKTPSKDLKKKAPPSRETSHQTKLPLRNSNAQSRPGAIASHDKASSNTTMNKSKSVSSSGSHSSTVAPTETKPKDERKQYPYPYTHRHVVQRYGSHPPSANSNYHNEYPRPPGRSPHIPPQVHYASRATHTPMHYAQPPSSSPHIPPRYMEGRENSPALPPGYSLPSTPRFQYGLQATSANSQSMVYNSSRPHMAGQPPHFGWPTTSNVATSRFMSPPLNTSQSIPPTRPTPARQPGMAVGKENSSNKGGSSSKSKRNACNCKRSRCLKLYCECFSAQIVCDGCNCSDCYNTEEHGHLRDKAIKELLSKNKTAFEPGGTQSIGCKCRKSECLKKYCECFQAGTVCQDHCKCVSCANRAGSQKLIDKRRKMKDTKGAEYAMQISKDVWEQQPRTVAIQKPSVIASREARTGTSIAQHPTVRASLRVAPNFYPRPALLGPPTKGSMGFSPMDAHNATNIKYSNNNVNVTENVTGRSTSTTVTSTPNVPSTSTTQTATLTTRPGSNFVSTAAVAITESINRRVITSDANVLSNTPAGVRRLSFDTTSVVTSNKKQKQSNDDVSIVEIGRTLLNLFGPNLPQLPSQTIASICSYLSESDLTRLR